MSMLLTSEQELLRDSAADFLQSQTPVSQQRQLRDDKAPLGFDAAVWQQMVEMGWPAAVLPEAHGGLEVGYLGLGSVFEGIGRQLAAQPLLTQAVIAPELLLRVGSPAQQAHWLPQLVEGKVRIALAVDEASGVHLPSSLQTCAVQTATGWSLSGSKHFVIDGVGADAFIVAAAGGAGAWGLWLVPAQAAGVRVQRMTLADSRNVALVHFEQVALSAEMALTAMPARQALDEVLDRARACLAAEALGLLREVFERTVAYLKERVQFDVPIGSFQALQHRAARLYTELELLQSCVLGVLEAIDANNGPAVALQASLAKAKASDLCERLCNEAVQMHGGIGVTDEMDIGLFLKRARVLQHSLGDGLFHRNRYAQLKGF